MNPPKQKPTLLLTRPLRQSENARNLFESAGFEVLIHPVIEILPPTDFALVDEAILQIPVYAGLIFSSANGVDFFVERLRQLVATDDSFCRAGEILERASLAAVGRETAAALKKQGLNARWVSKEERAEGLVAALAPHAVKGGRFLSLRANRGRDVIKNGLEHLGGAVTELAVYRSVDIKVAGEKITRRLAVGEIDFVTVTSSAIAVSLVNLFGESLKQTQLASLSPLTSRTLQSLGFSPVVEARSPSMRGILDAILDKIGKL